MVGPDIVKARGQSNIVWPFARLVEDGVVSEEKLITTLADVFGSLQVALYDINGNIVDTPSSDTFDMDGQTPQGVNVTIVTAAVLVANPNRKSAVFVNDSDTDIYLALTRPAVPNRGIRLNAGGGTLVLSRWGPLFTTGPINAVHGGAGNKILTVQEMI